MLRRLSIVLGGAAELRDKPLEAPGCPVGKNVAAVWNLAPSNSLNYVAAQSH